jgi:hypothetical protein
MALVHHCGSCYARALLCYALVSIFFVFWLFLIKIREMDLMKLFSIPTLLIHANHTDAIHEGVTLVHMMRLEGLTRAPSITVAPRRLESRQCTRRNWVVPAGVTSSDMVRLSYASPIGVTGPPRHRRPAFFLISFFLPLPLSPWRQLHWQFLIPLPLSKPVVTQIDSISWYPNYFGYVPHLYRLIFLYFEIFAWISSCGGDSRLNKCIRD